MSREANFGFFTRTVQFLIVIFLQDLCHIFMKSTLFSESLGVVGDLVISMELLSSILFSTVLICSCPYEEVYYPYRCLHKSGITLLLADSP